LLGLRQGELARRAPDRARLQHPEARFPKPGLRSDRLVKASASGRGVERLLGKGGGLVRRSGGTPKLVSPARLCSIRQAARWRRDGEAVLADFMAGAEPRFKGAVLVDGMWDNPNYWIRYALFRAAVGFAGGREVGVVGMYRAATGRRTLERFRIS